MTEHNVTFKYGEKSSIQMHGLLLKDVERLLDWINHPDPNEWFEFRTIRGNSEFMFESGSRKKDITDVIIEPSNAQF